MLFDINNFVAILSKMKLYGLIPAKASSRYAKLAQNMMQLLRRQSCADHI